MLSPAEVAMLASTWDSAFPLHFMGIMYDRSSHPARAAVIVVALSRSRWKSPIRDLKTVFAVDSAVAGQRATKIQ